MNTALQAELLALLDADYAEVNRITSDGTLLEPANPNRAHVITELRALAQRNVERLTRIMAEHGWPGVSLVGAAGATAAYRLVLHAFTLPAFQRSILPVLKKAAAAGEASWWDVSRLEDRMLALEGHLQRYGTQFSWNENGEQAPDPPVENVARANAERAAIGLCSLEDEIAYRNNALKAHRRFVSKEESSARRAQAEEWARLLGWRSETAAG
jgi:hypothetical protein